MKKEHIILVIVILVALGFCCCIFAATAAGAFLITQNVVSENATSLPASETLQAVPIDPWTDTPRETPAPSEPAQENTPESQSSESDGQLDEGLLSVMSKIERQVEQLRGLRLSNEVDRHTMTGEDLRERVMDDFFTDYTTKDARVDAQIMSLFGFLESDYDLYNLYIDLYSEQIAGFYDDIMKEMVIVKEEKFSGAEKMTYAHEFTHALQDEAYDLENGLGLNDDRCLADSEYCAAVQALVEGDATLTETLWFIDHSSAQDKKDVMEMYDDYQSPVYDSAPQYLQEDFLFAYTAGLEFVQYLYDQGGYAAVDEAYANPPVSTEQIMHPEKYPNDIPVTLDLPNFTSILSADWQIIDSGNLGEWYTYLMLAKPYDPDFALDQDDAEDAAQGWGGDQYQIFYNEQDRQNILVYVSQWDSVSESAEFWNHFTTYGNNRWGDPKLSSANYILWEEGEQVISFSHNANQVLWVMAADQESYGQILSAFGEFSQE
jgi:hypothetical protein